MHAKYVYNCYNKINALFSGQMINIFFFLLFINILFNLLCFDLVSECLSAHNALIFVSQIQKNKRKENGGGGGGGGGGRKVFFFFKGQTVH